MTSEDGMPLGPQADVGPWWGPGQFVHSLKRSLDDVGPEFGADLTGKPKLCATSHSATSQVIWQLFFEPLDTAGAGAMRRRPGLQASSFGSPKTKVFTTWFWHVWAASGGFSRRQGCGMLGETPATNSFGAKTNNWTKRGWQLLDFQEHTQLCCRMGPPKQ